MSGPTRARGSARRDIAPGAGAQWCHQVCSLKARYPSATCLGKVSVCFGNQGPGMSSPHMVLA